MVATLFPPLLSQKSTRTCPFVEDRRPRAQGFMFCAPCRQLQYNAQNEWKLPANWCCLSPTGKKQNACIHDKTRTIASTW